MRTKLIVFGLKAIELALLGTSVSGWRAGGFGLQRAMHPLVATVLLWLARLDQFREDAEPDPPGRQAGQARQRDGGKRQAVVGADALGQAEFAEDALKDGLSVGHSGRQQPLAGQQVAREAIGDGQRVTIDAVFGFELAFEVGAPDLIGGRDDRSRLARMAQVAALARSLDEAVTGEQIADGRAGRPVALGVAFGQELEEFLGAPGGVQATGVEQCRNEVRRGLMRAGLGFAGAVVKTRAARLVIAADPLIGGLSADAIVAAKFGEGVRVTKEIGDELSFVIHR